jgi:hypothetical protein
MVDDGFLIGFEDSSGNFVEVGRFNNTADDVSQPLEIKHANSGERITLDSSGLQTQKIDDDRLYAGAFPGGDADQRLSNALSSASAGSVINLEATTYFSDITISKDMILEGCATTTIKSTRVEATWTFTRPIIIRNAHFDSSATVNINSEDCCIMDVRNDTNPQINVNADAFRYVNCRRGIVNFASGTTLGIVDSCVETVVNDNGTNTVGDIA